jgi:hypothetical protein
MFACCSSQVVNPHEFLFNYAKASFDLERTKLEELVQMSWTFVNDSLVTTLCLQWEPEVIAIAMIHLALKLKKLTVRTRAHTRGKPTFIIP